MCYDPERKLSGKSFQCIARSCKICLKQSCRHIPKYFKTFWDLYIYMQIQFQQPQKLTIISGRHCSDGFCSYWHLKSFSSLFIVHIYIPLPTTWLVLPRLSLFLLRLLIETHYWLFNRSLFFFLERSKTLGTQRIWLQAALKSKHCCNHSFLRFICCSWINFKMTDFETTLNLYCKNV